MYLNKKHNLINVIRWSNLMIICILVFMAFDSFAFGAEVGEGAGEDKETMLSLLKKGGPVMYPLGLASILALALGLERFISLTKERVLPVGFLQGLGQAWNSDSTGQAAEKYCEDSSGACGHVFKAGIQWRNEGHQAVSKALEDAGSKEAEKMKRSLRPLSVIAGVCPLLGLLGTVYGMIDAFQKTADSGGAAKTADLANGIYQALVSTAAGLTIAIPVLLLFQWLSTRADKVIDHIDDVGTEFIVTHALANSAPTTGPADAGQDINDQTNVSEGTA
ncbi:MAG TPA: MotA/TolQ/ExbB proton channel family protein [Verrucomicrobia bacterium]|nr:MotA/TolQ/ExbB proton channel family protein [Verrucomicrobiales bacterium]HIL55619.1 MotA/TolQ/ExbB proton channel family protein [Verrucomicrobiota bacterium]